MSGYMPVTSRTKREEPLMIRPKNLMGGFINLKDIIGKEVQN